MHIPCPATKIFNYKKVSYDLNIVDFKLKPPDYTCACSPFIYNPAGHAITVYEMCSPKGINPSTSTGNISLNLLRISSRIVPDNEQRARTWILFPNV